MTIDLQSKMLITKSNLLRKRKRAFKPFIFFNSFIDDVVADEFAINPSCMYARGVEPLLHA
jgi:hypothetical protein